MHWWKAKHNKKQHVNPMEWDDVQEDTGYHARPCPVCNGRRKVPTTVQNEHGETVTIMDWCPNCGGSGVI